MDPIATVTAVHRTERVGASPSAEHSDVYRVALQFQSVATDIARRSPHPVRHQLERASLSGLLNTAEGWARRSPADKARLYVIALGSAAECGALLAVVARRSIVSDGMRVAASALLARVVRMLGRLELAMRNRQGSQQN